MKTHDSYKQFLFPFGLQIIQTAAKVEQNRIWSWRMKNVEKVTIGKFLSKKVRTYGFYHFR